MPDNLDALAADSPFMHPAETGAQVSAEIALELRSVVIDGDSVMLSIHDRATHSSKWIRLNDESGTPITIQGYDRTAGLAAIRYRGRPMVLGLRQAKMDLSSVNAVGELPVANRALPASQDEAGRLAVVVQEIARRNSLRAQADRNAGTTAGPPK